MLPKRLWGGGALALALAVPLLTPGTSSAQNVFFVQRGSPTQFASPGGLTPMYIYPIYNPANYNGAPTYLTPINYPFTYGAYNAYFAPSRFVFSATPTYFRPYPMETAALSTYAPAPRTLEEERPATPREMRADALTLNSFRPAHLDVRVPADAEVWFDGKRTNLTGSRRRYATRPLDPSRDYTYEVRARWSEDGEVVTRKRALTLAAGGRGMVHLFGAPEPPREMRAGPLR